MFKIDCGCGCKNKQSDKSNPMYFKKELPKENIQIQIKNK